MAGPWIARLGIQMRRSGGIRRYRATSANSRGGALVYRTAPPTAGGGGSRATGPSSRKTSLPWLVAIAASGCLGGYLVLADDSPNELHDKNQTTKKKVVVLGTGWGGIGFLKELDTSLYDVYVISPRNYFVFTPLLPSVTAGTVESRSIVEPIRRLLQHTDKKATFLEARCFKIDPANKKVHCRDISVIKVDGREEFTMDYDYLIVAVGAQPNTFGTPGVLEYCHFLKEVEHAKRIRETILDCFESASLPHLSKEEKSKLLHFVIVGGGPTGVEFAAELNDLIQDDLLVLYPNLFDLVHITVLQSADHILNTFDERISKFAELKFRRDGVDVRLGCRVLGVSEKEISFKDKATGKDIKIPYGMVVWSTGIGTRPVVADFMEQIGQSDRRVLATDEWLRVKGCEGVFGIGDCATIEQRRITEDISYLFKLADKDKSGTLSLQEFTDVMDEVRGRYPQIDIYLKRRQIQNITSLLDHVQPHGNVQLNIEQFKKAIAHVDTQMKGLPATAQVATQQGQYLAECFNHMGKAGGAPMGPVRIRGSGRHRFQPFQYKHFGQFAPLGGEQAAVELPGDWVSIGHSTQWLWYSVYASKQVSWRTRALVVFDWTKKLVFGRDSSRIHGAQAKEDAQTINQKSGEPKGGAPSGGGGGAGSGATK